MLSINLTKRVLITIFAFFAIFANNLYSQSVKQSLTEQSTNIKKYSFIYKISDSKQKTIIYIIVKDVNGNIKTCFDACDVCYPANKGYSQKNAQVVCNNCGNKFNIVDLGSQGSGGCWPGHLPHIIENDSIKIEESDLIAGSYLFPEETVNDVENHGSNCLNDLNKINYYCSNKILKLNTNSLDYTQASIYSISGKLCKELESDYNINEIDLSSMPEDIYILVLKNHNRTVSTLFYLTK